MSKRKPFCYVTTKKRAVSPALMDGYALKTAEDGSRQDIADEFEKLYSTQKLIQPTYNPGTLLFLLEMNSYHASCCEVKARDVGGLGYVLEPVTDNPSEANKNTLDKFFSGMNEDISKVLYKTRYDVEAIGYGGIELIREVPQVISPPKDLRHMRDAHKLRMNQDQKRILKQVGLKKYWFKLAGVEEDVHFQTGEIKPPGTIDHTKRANEVIWLNNYWPLSRTYGGPDVIPALGAIHGDFTREVYNREFFKNFGVPAYAVYITGNFEPGEEDEKGRTEIEKSIEDAMENIVDAPHSPMILTIPSMGGEKSEVTVHFEKLSAEVKESSFRLYRKDNRDEVIQAHRTPPYRIGVFETGQMAGNLGEMADKIYKTSVIEPRQQELEAIIGKIIIRGGFNIHDWKFNLASIDLAEDKQELALQKELQDMNVLTAQEIRVKWADRMGVDPEMPGQPTPEEFRQLQEAYERLRREVERPE